MGRVSENNKRIAKNTGMLYIRMLLIMAVSLYTSRVILNVLGEQDYGIYDVVGGIVMMLSFMNSSLNTATQRFLNYEMGKGRSENLQKIFSISFICFGIIAIFVLILGETIGLWFVANKLVIPESRINIAIWVFHFSVMTFIVNLLTIPYQAAIIAHERMSIYAYISIAEVGLRLLLVLLLQIIAWDKLLLYAGLIFASSCMIAFAYKIICSRLFPECHLKWSWDNRLFKGLFSFSGWMLIGTSTNLLSTQGISILINMFFGPILNAARGVAMQVNTAINSFVSNFLKAVHPQIMKSYAQNNIDYLYKLVFSASKFSFYLLFVLIIPILFNTNYILGLWLVRVPQYAVIFTQLILVDLLINAAYHPIGYVAQASGKIRDYQITISIGFCLIALFTWVVYKLGFPVYFTFIVAIVIDILGLFARLIVLYKTVTFPVRDYLRKVITPLLLIFLISMILSFFPKQIYIFDTLLSVILYSLYCVGITSMGIWFIGLDKSEKNLISQGIHNIIKIKKYDKNM